MTSTSKLPGKLNAAHASATARLNAAPNSTVGKIAAYEKALAADEPDLTEAAKALSSLTGKELTVETIAALNALLGLEDVDPAEVLAEVEAARKGEDLPSDDTDEVAETETGETEAVSESDITVVVDSTGVTPTQPLE